MIVPFFDLKRQYTQIKREIEKRVRTVFKDGEYCFGKETVTFENSFADFAGCRFATATGSGTEALIAALKAVGVGLGDNVITTPTTFIATAEAIVWAGAKPIFVDIDPNNWNIDISKIGRAINPRTKAILPVHFNGVCVEIGKIKKIIAGRKIGIIEDASHAIGSSLNGIPAGALGDVGCFSLYPSKTLGAYGNAGVVVTNNPDIALEVKKVLNHGRGEDKNIHERIGLTATINNIQSAILNVKMKYLRQAIKRRISIAQKYTKGLKDLPVQFQQEPNGANTCNYVYSLAVKDKKVLREYLNNCGIGAGIYYPKPLHLQPSMAFLGHKLGDFPIAEQLADEIISLPLFPELTDREVYAVIQGVKSFYKQR